MLSTLRFSRPRHFRLLIAASLAINTLALALPLMTMQVYDRILSNHSYDTLIILSGGVLLAALVEFILRCCRSMVTGLNGAQFEHDTATAALKQLLETEPRHTSRIPSVIMAQDVGAAARLKDYYGGQMMVTLLIDIPFIFVFLSFIAYLTGWLVLVPVAILSLFLVLSWRQGTELRHLIGQRDEADNQRYSFITESLQSIHSIKALCLEAPISRQFEEVQRESGPVNYRIACLNGQAASLSYGFAQLMTVGVLCAGAPLAVQGYLSIGGLIACVLLSGQIMQPLQRGLAMWIRFQDISKAQIRLRKLFGLPSRDFLPVDTLGENHGELTLRQVRFAYKDGQPVLDGTSLSIAPGDAIAITGTSGCGKTTLLEVMAGIYPPDRGEILLGDMELSRIPVSERSRYIAYLPINGMILRGSIMDNLTGFNPAARAQARQVADQLGIEDAVSLLPSGYDTSLEGHMTDVISPGLKQRISIARALLNKPRLILFDNADHGMDHDSYSRIFSLMARLKGKATLVLVSEDLNILSLADHVYDLRHGQLTATATPAPIMTARRVAGVSNQARGSR